MSVAAISADDIRRSLRPTTDRCTPPSWSEPSAPAKAKVAEIVADVGSVAAVICAAVPIAAPTDEEMRERTSELVAEHGLRLDHDPDPHSHLKVWSAAQEQACRWLAERPFTAADLQHWDDLQERMIRRFAADDWACVFDGVSGAYDDSMTVDEAIDTAAEFIETRVQRLLGRVS